MTHVLEGTTPQPIQRLYHVQLIDATFTDAYRTETVLGHHHVVDELTLVIHVNEIARQCFNWHWVIGFGYDEVENVPCRTRIDDSLVSEADDQP